MRFLLFLVCLLAGTTLRVVAQCSGKWAQQISPLPSGNLTSDYPKVVVDGIGNVIVCSGIYNAESLSTDGQTFPETTASGPNSDLFVAKYDQEGNVLWLKTMVGVGSTIPIDMVADSFGNTYLCGLMASSMTLDGVEISRNGSTQPGYFVLKLSPDGELEWYRKSDLNGSRGSAICWNGTALIFAVAYSDSVQIGNQIFYTGSQDVAHNQDIVICKMDSAGNIISATNIGGSGNIDLRAMECTSSECVLQGRFDKELSLDGLVLTTPAIGHNSLYQLSIQLNGTINWVHGSTNSSEFNVRPNGLGIIDDDYAIFSMNYWYSSMILGGYDLPAPNQSDIVIGKLRLSDGEIIWLKRVEGLSYENSGDLISLDGTAWLGGNFYSDVLTFDGYSIDKMGSGEHDGFVLSVDSEGKPRCGLTIDGTGTAAIWSIEKPSDDYIVALVQFSGSIDFAGQTYTASGVYDLLIIKTCLPCDTLTSVTEAEQQKPALQLHPNPASHTIRVGVQGSKYKVQSITFIDMLGHAVLYLKTTTNENNINISHLANGLYTVVATTEDGETHRQRLVVQH